MSIEVRQLIVKSNVIQAAGASGGCSNDGGESGSHEDSKKAILDECRRMVLEILRDHKER